MTAVVRLTNKCFLYFMMYGSEGWWPVSDSTQVPEVQFTHHPLQLYPSSVREEWNNHTDSSAWLFHPSCQYLYSSSSQIRVWGCCWSSLSGGTSYSTDEEFHCKKKSFKNQHRCCTFMSPFGDDYWCFLAQTAGGQNRELKLLWPSVSRGFP